MSDITTRIKRDSDGTLRVVMFIVFLPILVGAIVWAASLMSDSGRVPAELAAAKRESGVMLCTEGAIVHGDGSFLDRLFADGRFRCTWWRMRNIQVDTATGTVNWPTSPHR
jgi:hypothetical protein